MRIFIVPTNYVLPSHSNNRVTSTGFCNLFSSQVTTHPEIRKNLPLKSFTSNIENGNKLSLKETFRTFRHKRPQGWMIQTSKEKFITINQLNFAILDMFWDIPIMDGIEKSPLPQFNSVIWCLTTVKLGRNRI